jgi:cyclase
MLKSRVIPCLLLKGEGLVKTHKFKNPKYIGDPINSIRIFNEKEVDELMVLDITASREGRQPNFAMIERFASECFIPLAYGGGIKTIEQARQLFAIGVEKVVLQTSVLEDTSLITKLSDQFGSQSVLVSLDIGRNLVGQRKLFSSKLGKNVQTDWQVFLKKVVDAGSGEIVLNAVDLDGTMKGMDLDLIKSATKLVSVPIIAIGGVGSLHDIKAAINAGASAVAAGAFFVFHGPFRAVLITYPGYKELEKLFEK